MFVRLASIVLALSAVGGMSSALVQSAAARGAECGPTLYDCAVAQVGKREFAAAIRTLEQVLAQTPKDLKALNLLGIALIGADRRDDANARFRAALAIDPRFHPARKNLAINEFQAGRLDDARRHLEEVLKEAPDDEIAHVHLGEIHFQRKQRREALPHYERARARVAQNPRWTLHYAICLLDGARKDDAVALLDRLPEDDAAIRFEAGVALGEARAYAEAARFFGSARAIGAKARPSGADDTYAAGYNQTLMLIEAGDADAAIRVAEEVLAQSQGAQDRHAARAAELQNLVSRAYAKAGRIKEAYDALREAARLEPTVADHYIDLAMLCLEHENYDLGLEIVDVGLEHRPDASVLYLQRGVVLAMKGAIEQAEKEFDRASRAAPDDPAPYVALAMTWMLRGETPKAVEVLRARTRTGEPRAVLFYALGMALLRSGAAPDDEAGTEAMEAFRTATRLAPDFPQAQAELGKILLKRNDVPGAIDHLEKALTLEPNESAPAYVLAQAYRRAGRIDRAQELLARVSKLNAEERGDDPDGNRDIKRMVVRIVRDSTNRTPASATANASATATTATRTAGASEGAGAKDAVADRASSSGMATGTTATRPAGASGSAAAKDAVGDRASSSGTATATTATRPAGASGSAGAKETVGDRAPSSGMATGTTATRSAGASGGAGAKDAVGDRASSSGMATATTAPRPAGASGSAGAREAVGDRGSSSGMAIEARYERATACSSSGDIDGAIAELRRVVDAAPKFAAARYQLGVNLWNRFKRPIGGRQKRDLDDAVAQLTHAIELEPMQPLFHLVLGQLLAEQQRLAPAIDHLRRALALASAATPAASDKAAVGTVGTVGTPDTVGTPGTAGTAGAVGAARTRGVAGTVGNVAAIGAVDPAEYPYNLGLALRLNGDLDEAETQFRAAIARNPDHALARRSLGLVLRHKDDAAAAVVELRRAVELLPDDAQGRHLLATVLIKLGDLPGATMELREATRLDPSLIEARVTLAQTLARSGHKDDALKEQAEVRRLNAEKADFGRMLVLLDSSAALIDKGDVVGAIAQRREAVTLSPRFAEAHYQLALALRASASTGQTPKAGADVDAEAALRQAITLDPTHARAHAELARLLDLRGDKAGADQARRRAAALAPCS